MLVRFRSGDDKREPLVLADGGNRLEIRMICVTDVRERAEYILSSDQFRRHRGQELIQVCFAAHDCLRPLTPGLAGNVRDDG